MDEPFSTSSDNYSEVITLNTTVTLPTTLRSAIGQSLTKDVVATVGLIVCGIGICANSVVLAVMVRARRQFGSSVHTLIANQSGMDLFTCSFSIPVYILILAHGFKYNGNEILDGAICLFVEGGALSAFGLVADNFGLVVITLERYFKIVHAIAHRKYYRNWMTKMGVALPWIGGACLILFPAMGTTRVVNGRCLRMRVWPNEAMSLVRLHILTGRQQSLRSIAELCILLTVGLHVCPSVRLSHAKATQATIRKSSPTDSPRNLVLAIKVHLEIRKGSPQVRGLNKSMVGQIYNF